MATIYRARRHAARPRRGRQAAPPRVPARPRLLRRGSARRPRRPRRSATPTSSPSTTTARTRPARTSSWSWSTARTSRRSSGGAARCRRARSPGSAPPSARALAAAHARGIVHRDVKPGNVLIGRDGRVKVADFGIARAIAEAQLTLPGTTLGSVHYFSPEQARGEPATAASDIYASGIVLYEMLTGTRPWEGDSAAAVALARLSGPAPDPMAVRASVPPDLAAITRKALALEPGDRFVSAAAMADALDRRS